MGAALTGWGVALPEKELTNRELAPRLGLTEEWIFERTGIESRRIVGPGETTVTLATAAGRAALQHAGVDPDAVDVVLLATCTPDHKMPASASLVQHALGASNAGAFDVNAACSGFVYALAQAAALIEAGTARRTLVIGSDVLTTVTDYNDPKSCVIFGDGAGATLLEQTEGPTRLGHFQLGSDGSEPELLWIPNETGVIHMKGREVYRRAVEGMTRSVRDVLEGAGLAVDDVDLLVAHQANARILEAVAGRLGLSRERVALNIASVGNTSAASIPIALHEAVASGQLHDDDIVVLTTFGAGFTWATGVLRWGPGRASGTADELSARKDAEMALAGGHGA
ncbi:MAG TPA: beta-ketoacyl-ACP synthase III [Actinomycetota bacterium]|nr:beta-ketoacyl-ACP synthase III [Actinomycetota bacterium]